MVLVRKLFLFLAKNNTNLKRYLHLDESILRSWLVAMANTEVVTP